MEKKTDPRTVFVRGIDASVSDSQLQDFFSELGPVKNAFLVRRGKDGPHRGFGFVQFSVQEDAARAVTELNGRELAGRKLKVEGAVKRAPLEERKKRKQEAGATPPPQGDQQPPEAGEAAQQPPPAKKLRPSKPTSKPSPAAVAAAEAKHKWMRTVAVGGLTPDTVASAVLMARAAAEVEDVIQPVPDKLAAQFLLRRDGCTGDSFLAVYKSVKQANAAVARLHGQTAGGGGGDAPGKHGGKKVQGEAVPGSRVWARQLSGEGLHQKRWRLIVRNLPFTASEADLQQAFAPAGFVWELSLPRSTTGRGRGFAFVGFTSKAHAERGIRLVNGTTVAGRPVAVDWAVAKMLYGSAQQQEQAAASGEGGAGAGKAAGSLPPQCRIDGLDSDSEDEGSGPTAKLGHEEEGDSEAAAALAPDQERRMLASVIDGLLESGDKEEGATEAEGSGEEEEEEERSEVEGSEEAMGTAGGSGSKQEEAGQPATGSSAAADPFSRKQLQKKAEAAGAAAAAAPGGDQGLQHAEPEQGATVFVRGLPLDVSKEQLFLKMKAYGPVRSCRLVVDKASGKLKGTAFVDFYKRASAQSVAYACAKGRRKEGPGVVVAGLPAEVDLALGQEDVRALAVSKAAERGPRDNQRLGLAREGAIAEGSPAWEDMPAGDRIKRKRAAEEKKLKLKSPNFVVSDTRLSVRNVPHAWTEKQLKACFIAAVQQRASKAQPQVRQAKILLDEERPGPDGTPRSKGIGFVEFTEHEHALCALRQLNNNPTAFNRERRPIVEFALENVKALKLREAKMAKAKQSREQQQQQQERAARGGGTAPPAGAGQQQQHKGERGDAEPAAPKSKRLLRKERRLMLKERSQQRKPPQEAEGDGVATEGANGTPGGDDERRSARRRELRKRKQEGQQGLTPAAGTAKPAENPAAKPVQNASSRPAKLAAAGKQQQQQWPPRPGVNSRAAKAATASQEKQQAQRRKQSADELIDKLVEAPQGELRAKRQHKKEQTDNVDKLAKRYINKFFSDVPAAKAGKGTGAARSGSGGNGAGAMANQRAALKRWFE